MTTRWLGAITIALTLAGCKLAPGACSRHSDCPTGQCAPTGMCAVGDDASASDAESDAEGDATVIPPLEPDAGVDAATDAATDPDAAFAGPTDDHE